MAARRGCSKWLSTVAETLDLGQPTERNSLVRHSIGPSGSRSCRQYVEISPQLSWTDARLSPSDLEAPAARLFRSEGCHRAVVTSLEELWPPFALSISCGPLTLRAVRDDDLPDSVDAAAAGIHGDDLRPFPPT